MTAIEDGVLPALPDRSDAGGGLDILLIEDNPVDAAMVRALLADELSVVHRCALARTLAEGRTALAGSSPSCVLLDLGLPDSDGLATLNEIIALAPDTPIVVFTGLDDDDTGREAVTHGAQDFLVKGKTDSGLLVRSIRYAVDRQQAEAARRRGEDLFRVAIGSMIDPVLIANSIREPGGRIVDFRLDYANGAGCQLLGLRDDQVAGRTLLDVAPALPGELMEACRRVVDAGESFSGRQAYEGPLNARGHVSLWMDVKIVRLGDGYLLSAHDVTRRVAAEQALRDSEERFRGLIENSTDIILVVDAGGHVRYFSPAGLSVLGYAPEAMIGESFHDLVHPDDLRAAMTALEEAPSLSVGQRVTLRLRHASGTWRWVEATTNNRLEDPSICGIVVNARDVTDQTNTALALKDVNRVLRTLTAADTAVVHATDEGALADAMCQLIVETGGYPRSCIAAVDPSHPRGIVPVANRGGDERFFAAVLDASAVTPSDPIFEAARHGRTRVVHDIGDVPTDLPVRQITLDHGYRSLIVLPLRVDHDVLGVLAIYANEPHAFDTEEVSLLERLAANLAFGLTSLRARAERQGYFEQVERSLGAMADTIVTTVEYRDPYTAGHQRRVAQLAAAIGRELALDAGAIAGIEMAASIHDIGKISVPAEILSKPGRLTDVEFELVKQHSRTGYEIVKGIDFRGPVAEMILEHHERCDGSGYPSGLVGDAILLGARIIAVADTVEATSSHRPYRPSLGVPVALTQIEAQRGQSLDADVTDACLRVFREGGFSFETSPRFGPPWG